jgi:radical SAM-linked protein
LSLPPYDSAFETVLAAIRQPARLIGEEAGAGPGFSGDPLELRVVLGFPDTYEIAISNQALQILYYLARLADGVGVERAYLPWVDATEEMRRASVPLLTLETWTPVREAHLLGITLQHELHYTNLLEMLDLAGIPLHAEERTQQQALVLVGGPACANFAPFSRFVDAVAVGDGEEVFPEILEVVGQARRLGLPRDEAKRRLAQVQGVFVPDMSTSVRRRAIPRLTGAPYPPSCLVPLVAGVHDRAWVEVMRGCTRGCRFCQAGMWYRPVRERAPEEVLDLTARELAETGHQELAFASLSTTDYSGLSEVLAGVAVSHPEVSLSLPSLRVDTASVRLAWLASPTGASLTLAPEAGSQRMRDVINKNVTEDDILAAADEAFRTGRTTLKLYFMIGLPEETDDDVVAIADLCIKIRLRGREALGARAGRLQLNVSVNSFIPKPFTPFQWAAMADRETISRRQALLRTRLRKPGIRLAMPDPGRGYLEAALARGDASMGEVIESAWRKGARFDPWTEQFRPAAWAAAFEEAGTTAEVLATTPLAGDLPLPWDTVDGVPDHAFLWAEWQKAARGEATGDCRWDGCTVCGACDDPPGNDLARAAGFAVATAPTPEQAAPLAGQTASPAGQGGSRGGVPWRYVCRFSVTGRGRFLGHLDRMEAFRRAVRRAGGRLALSAGMRPKAQLSLALPLGVGVEGLQELCEFELAEDPGIGFEERLGQALPGHMRLLGLESYSGRRRVAARVNAAAYQVLFSAEGSDLGGSAAGASVARRGAGPVAAALSEGVRRLGEAADWPVEEIREGRRRVVDIKLYLQELVLEPGRRGPRDEVGDPILGGADRNRAGADAVADRNPTGLWTLEFTAAVTPTGTARPEAVLQALAQASGLRLKAVSVRRTQILLD